MWVPQPLNERLLIIGASVRPWVQSAILESIEFTAFDFFADWDTVASIDSLGSDNTSRVHRLESFDQIFDSRFESAIRLCDSAIVCGGFETRIHLVNRLERQIELLGPCSKRLSRLLNCVRVSDDLEKLGIDYPTTKPSLLGLDTPSDWLRKEPQSSGGSGVRLALPRDVHGGSDSACFQALCRGNLLSAVFVSSHEQETRRGKTVLVSLSRQWVGKPGLGANGFQYCGSVDVATTRELRQSAADIATVISSEFGLKGLWGIDFVDSDLGLVPIDINPRLTASMELIGLNPGSRKSNRPGLLEMHVRACRGDLVKDNNAEDNNAEFVFEAQGNQTSPSEGKAILFNKSDQPLEITTLMFERIVDFFDAEFFVQTKLGRSIADVPFIGQKILPRHPFLTVRIRTESAEQVETELQRFAAVIYDVTS